VLRACVRARLFVVTVRVVPHWCAMRYTFVFRFDSPLPDAFTNDFRSLFVREMRERGGGVVRVIKRVELQVPRLRASPASHAQRALWTVVHANPQRMVSIATAREPVIRKPLVPKPDALGIRDENLKPTIVSPRLEPEVLLSARY